MGDERYLFPGIDTGAEQPRAGNGDRLGPTSRSRGSPAPGSKSRGSGRDSNGRRWASDAHANGRSSSKDRHVNGSLTTSDGSSGELATTNQLLAQLLELQQQQADKDWGRQQVAAKKERLQRRRASRHTQASTVAEALGVVCALLASTMLSSLVYPPEVVIDPDFWGEPGGSISACYASGVGVCRTWQTVYGVSSSLAFTLCMVALLMTIEVAMGRRAWLHRSLVVFFTGVQSSAVTVIATFWLSYPLSLAQFSIVSMSAFIVLTMLLLPSVLTFTYYYLPGVGGRATMLRKLGSDKYQGTLLANPRNIQDIQEGVSSLHLVLYVLLDEAAFQKPGASGAGAGVLGRLVRFSFDSWLRLLLLAEDEFSQDRSAVSPLLLVAFMGDARWAHTMLNSGVDPDVEFVDESGAVYFPLFVAAREGHEAVVEVLLRGDANPHKVDGNGQTALHAAAWGGCLPCVESLLYAGVDPHAVDAAGRTPLLWAAEKGHADVVGRLLSAGASAHSVDNDGRSALHLAANAGHSRVVQLLLKAGANVNAKASSDGWIPLHAAAWGGDVATVEALLEAGSNVNTGAATGSTPLHEACEQGHSAVVDVLLSAGANPNSGYSRWSPLHAAAVAGNADIVQVLLSAGGNPRLHQGWTALHVAAWSGNRAVVQALLGAGADPGRGDEDGRTALHAAAWGANDEVVKALLDAGADPCAGDAYGRTPLDEALAGGYTEVARALEGAVCTPADSDNAVAEPAAAEDVSPLACSIPPRALSGSSSGGGRGPPPPAALPAGRRANGRCQGRGVPSWEPPNGAFSSSGASHNSVLRCAPLRALHNRPSMQLAWTRKSLAARAAVVATAAARPRFVLHARPPHGRLFSLAL
ncbi:hypothetical protein N2152v2_002729 [Parachlorella kessleri]